MCRISPRRLAAPSERWGHCSSHEAWRTRLVRWRGRRLVCLPAAHLVDAVDGLALLQPAARQPLDDGWVPVGHVQQAMARHPPLLEQRRVHEAHATDAALPERALPPPQRPVVGTEMDVSWISKQARGQASTLKPAPRQPPSSPTPPPPHPPPLSVEKMMTVLSYSPARLSAAVTLPTPSSSLYTMAAYTRRARSCT